MSVKLTHCKKIESELKGDAQLKPHPQKLNSRRNAALKKPAKIFGLTEKKASLQTPLYSALP